MKKSDLFKIAFAAVVAVVFKEFLTWLIKVSKPFAAIAARISGKWVLSHAFAIEFGVDCALLILFFALFLNYPSNGNSCDLRGN